MSFSRMPRTDRRDSLLDAGWQLIAERGVDTLTLAEVAKLGGVSKPVAYDHFGTRAGLLCALYDRYYSDHISKLKSALGSATTIAAAATLIASAYVDCVIESGPVAAALSGAMNGGAEMDAMKLDCDDRYIALCAATLTDRAGVAPAALAMVGFIGAAASVSQNVVLGRTSRDEAILYLATLLVGSVHELPRAPTG